MKKLYIFALSVFTVGSALCGFAGNVEFMIAARIVQAIGGGMIMPVGMAMIYQLVPKEKRGFALGIWGISIMVAPAIGPTLSGYIVEYLDWRIIFTINIPVGIIGIALALIMLRETEIKQDKKFDYFGAIACAIGLFTLLLGLNQGNSKGWTSIYEIILFIIAAIALISFVFIELKVREPLIDLKMLKIFPFSLSLCISSIVTLGMYGALFLIPIYVQNIRGYTPMQSGLISLPSAVLTGIMMLISGEIFDKFGGKWITVIGTVILASASFELSKLSLDTSYMTIVIIMILRGLGMGMATMTVQTFGMNAVPKHLISRATALNNTMKQISSSFGIAILTMLIQRREAFYTLRYAESFNLSSQEVIKAQDAFVSAASQHGLNQAAALAQIRSKLITVAGINDALLVTTFICLAAVPLALLINDKRDKVN